MAKSEYNNFLYQMQLAYAVANSPGNYVTLRPWEKFWYYVNVKTDYQLSKGQIAHKQKDITMVIDEEKRQLKFQDQRLKVENYKWFHFLFDVSENLQEEEKQWKDVVYRREHRNQVKAKDKRFGKILALLDGLDTAQLQSLKEEINSRLD